MQSCIFLSCDFLTSSLLQKKLRTQISRHQRTQESLTQLCTYSLSATRRMRGSLVTLAFLLTLAALHSEASEGKICYSHSPGQREHSGWRQGAKGRTHGCSRKGCMGVSEKQTASLLRISPHSWLGLTSASSGERKT